MIVILLRLQIQFLDPLISLLNFSCFSSYKSFMFTCFPKSSSLLVLILPTNFRPTLSDLHFIILRWHRNASILQLTYFVTYFRLPLFSKSVNLARFFMNSVSPILSHLYSFTMIAGLFSNCLTITCAHN